MAISLDTILGLSRYATATITFERQVIQSSDYFELDGSSFYFRNVKDEEDISSVQIGDTIEETVLNLKAQVEEALAYAESEQGYQGLLAAEYVWGAQSLTVTSVLPGNDGLDFDIDISSYSVPPQVYLVRGANNLTPGDTITFNGIVFTIKVDGEGYDNDVLTDVLWYDNPGQTFGQVWNRALGYKYSALDSPNPLRYIDFSTDSETTTVSFYSEDDEPGFGAGLTASWNLANTTINGVAVGSATFSDGDPGDRITGPDTLELDEMTFDGIDEEKADSNYEAAIATLIDVVASIFTNTDDPNTDMTKVRNGNKH